jgi:UDP-N-acetylmuramate--alanine ligase
LKKENDFFGSNNVFFIGIGGAGMSAIALVLKGMGIEVAGSDIKESRYTDILKKEDIRIFIGHKYNNIKGYDAVVYSTAIPHDNIELKTAKNEGKKLFTRSDVLAWVLNNSHGIAVAGTHGKTTTTSMIAMMLRGLQIDPTIIIGGELNELGTNARYGNGKFTIAEACESDGSFIKYKPFISVITNIEEDHMDHYLSFKKLEESFIHFIKNTKKEGYVLINGDEISLDIDSLDIQAKVITFGTSEKNDIFAKDIQLLNGNSQYVMAIREGEDITDFPVKLNVPGIHNIKNSLSALSCCYAAGMDVQRCIRLLEFFTGVKRRFEKRGEKNGALIYDDYAHHPTEVKATIDAAAIGNGKRIISVFQPHRYTRLKSLCDKFGECFDNSDILILTEVYGSGENPIPGVNSKMLLDKILDNGFKKKAVYIPKISDIKAYLETIIGENDIILVMGAGDVTRVSEDLLKS